MSREADLYKDKIEVSLDGRQIFYLFFGGAVIVGLVFVLGVMVGRRVEARGHVDRARTTAAVDPLAALDRLEGNGLSFKGALMNKAGGATDAPSEVERAIDEIEQARGAKGADAKAGASADAKAEDKAAKPEAKADDKSAKADDKSAKTEAKTGAKTEAKPEAKPDDRSAKTEAKPDAKAVAKADAKTEPRSDAKSVTKVDDKAAAKAEGKTGSKTEALSAKSDRKSDDDDDKPVTRPADVKSDSDRKPKYTLQLSSFQDKAEADAFLSSLKASGYKAHIIAAEVAGKGTFYRVRMGSYSSIDAANGAKAEFEKASKKTASVMRL